MKRQEILQMKSEAITLIERASSKDAIFALRKKYLGRKSAFNQTLKGLKNLSQEERKVLGSLANAVKREIDAALLCAEASVSVDFEKERIDITIQGKKIACGHLHPLTIVERDIESIFTAMGFEIADGPEVETEFYNFDALNIPEDHASRDMQDTFWLTQKGKKGENLLLRTHTYSVQVRYMEKHTPPFRIIIPGRIFRHEATDAFHEHTFNQFEALMVGDAVTVGNFKYIAEQFFSQFFKKDVSVRLRPSYFPFTEPSFEFDISCTVCGGKKCRACGQTGWLEVGGAGMVHQNVFVSSGYPRDRYQGFAWGFGIERLAMMKYKIDDIRLFHSGD